MVLTGGQAQITRCFFKRVGHGMPIHQTTGQLQAHGQRIARQLKQLHGRQLFAEKVHPNFIQLMGLVKHRDPHGRQQLGHTRLAHRHVGKKQMVVDDHHIGRHGFFARQIDVASAVTGATGAQTILTR